MGYGKSRRIILNNGHHFIPNSEEANWYQEHAQEDKISPLICKARNQRPNVGIIKEYESPWPHDVAESYAVRNRSEVAEPSACNRPDKRTMEEYYVRIIFEQALCWRGLPTQF